MMVIKSQPTKGVSRMDLKQLQYFVAIAEAGSITAAAKKLHLSQPPLSMQLKLLEEEMGTLLIERGPRSVTLTDAGRLLYRHAKQILTMADNALHDLADFNQGLRGTLRPVSYTHLDVYKRQSWKWSALWAEVKQCGSD